MVDDDEVVLVGGIERDGPRLGQRRVLRPKLLDRREVAGCKGCVEQLHSVVIIEIARADFGANGVGNAKVEGGEITNAAGLAQCPDNQLLQLGDHAVHRVEYLWETHNKVGRRLLIGMHSLADEAVGHKALGSLKLGCEHSPAPKPIYPRTTIWFWILK